MAKRKSFKSFYKNYLDNKIKLKKYQIVGIFLLIWVIAGIVGWIYEFFVGLFGTGELNMQGGNFLPWINIYAFGAILIVPAVYKFKKYPWAVFLLSVLITGVVELLGGWLVYTIGNGTRYWNYNQGLWAIGSINGFVCPLSVIFFGIGALFLIYLVLPCLVQLALRMSKRAFLILAVSLFILVTADELINLTLKNLDRPTAVEFYQSLGAKYQEF